MGTFKQGIYGGYSGKVGNVVGSSWKGIDVMRIMPASVANPQTVPQLTQRQKFSVTMGFLQPISEFLKTGFRNYAVRMTGINAAMSYNIRNAVSGAYPNYTIDYPNVLVSRGSLPAALNPAAAAGAAGKVVFTWDDNSTEIGADASDKSLIVVYNPVKQQRATTQGRPYNIKSNENNKIIYHRNYHLPAFFLGMHCNNRRGCKSFGSGSAVDCKADFDCGIGSL